MQKYGSEQMSKDVAKLQTLNKEAREKCVIGESDRAHMDKNSLYRPFSSEVVAYQVR